MDAIHDTRNSLTAQLSTPHPQPAPRITYTQSDPPADLWQRLARIYDLAARLESEAQAERQDRITARLSSAGYTAAPGILAGRPVARLVSPIGEARKAT